MIKFLVVFVSLILTIGGGWFSYITYYCVDEIRDKVRYSGMTNDQQTKFDTLVKNTSTYLFIATVIGICMFIAGLFI